MFGFLQAARATQTPAAQNAAGAAGVPVGNAGGAGGSMTLYDQAQTVENAQQASAAGAGGGTALVGDVAGWGAIAQAAADVIGTGAMAYFGYQSMKTQAEAPQELMEEYFRHSRKALRIARQQHRNQLMAASLSESATATGRMVAAKNKTTRARNVALLGIGLTAVAALGLTTVVWVTTREKK